MLTNNETAIFIGNKREVLNEHYVFHNAIKSKFKPKYLLFPAFHGHLNNGGLETLLKHQLSPEIAKLAHSKKLKFSKKSHIVCSYLKVTKVYSKILLMKSSKNDFIFLPAFYLVMCLMKDPNNF